MFNPYFFKSAVFVSHITIHGVKICRICNCRIKWNKNYDIIQLVIWM